MCVNGKVKFVPTHAGASPVGRVFGINFGVSNCAVLKSDSDPSTATTVNLTLCALGGTATLIVPADLKEPTTLYGDPISVSSFIYTFIRSNAFVYACPAESNPFQVMFNIPLK